jgi:hypothetical protein
MLLTVARRSTRPNLSSLSNDVSIDQEKHRYRMRKRPSQYQAVSCTAPRRERRSNRAKKRRNLHFALYGLTIIPRALRKQHPTSRLAYLIRPLRMYGQPILATSAGAMLTNAIIPFGVDGGTRSRAADRIMTYNTGAE